MNDDGVIDEYDWVRTPKGAYPNRPEIVYGFGITLGYDGFYVTPFFQGVANVSAYLVLFSSGMPERDSSHRDTAAGEIPVVRAP